jgi:rubrerythrin
LLDVSYYKCIECGYEFLAKTEGSKCPRCGNSKMEKKDVSGLNGLDG